MNIFFLHRHPRRCARWHCDKHVVKMLVETCQLLYTCHWMVDGTHHGTHHLHTAPYRVGTDTRGYKKTHWNHPCSKWVRQSLANYRWLAKLGSELLREYAHRFPSKRRAHACTPHLEWLSVNHPRGLLDSGWIPPPMCMPDPYKTGDVVSALLYRRKENVAPLHGSTRPALGTRATHFGKRVKKA